MTRLAAVNSKPVNTVNSAQRVEGSYVDLSELATEAGLSLAPRLASALTLIQESAAFEGNGDLAAAHLVLHDLLRDVEELRERIELSLDHAPPSQSEQILRVLLYAE